ncbi:hypothetical protein LCGC14_0375390 [marine sediment metagenome]|uniref:Uncharacterized protein n=1 Tax=marine sediment metagenome TaxID=412755 RepID=A0A0F9TM33_9ZZZZ
METVKVNNSRLSLVTLPAIKGVGGPVPLKPGINKVSEEYMEALVKKPGIEPFFDSEKGGFLEIVEEGEPLIAPDVKETLIGMNVKNAVSLIESCADLQQLDQWHKADTRKGVHDAVEKRATELAKEATPTPATTAETGADPAGDSEGTSAGDSEKGTTPFSV